MNEALTLLTIQGYEAVKKERLIEMIRSEKFLDILEKKKEIELFAVVERNGEEFEVHTGLTARLVTISDQVREDCWLTAKGYQRFLEKKDGTGSEEIWEYVEVLGKRIKSVKDKYSDGCEFAGRIRKDIQDEICKWLERKEIIGVFVQRPDQEFNILSSWKCAQRKSV